MVFHSQTEQGRSSVQHDRESSPLHPRQAPPSDDARTAGRGAEVRELKSLSNVTKTALRAELAQAKEERDKFEAESEQKGADLMACEGRLAEGLEDADLASLTPDMLRIQILQLRDLIESERLSWAKIVKERDEEIAKYVKDRWDDMNAVRAEKAARAQAEARVKELAENLRVEANACKREEVRSDAHLARVHELESLLASKEESNG